MGCVLILIRLLKIYPPETLKFPTSSNWAVMMFMPNLGLFRAKSLE